MVVLLVCYKDTIFIHMSSMILYSIRGGAHSTLSFGKITVSYYYVDNMYHNLRTWWYISTI